MLYDLQMRRGPFHSRSFYPKKDVYDTHLVVPCCGILAVDVTYT